jgi:hypothetical protein
VEQSFSLVPDEKRLREALDPTGLRMNTHRFGAGTADDVRDVQYFSAWIEALGFSDSLTLAALNFWEVRVVQS